MSRSLGTAKQVFPLHFFSQLTLVAHVAAHGADGRGTAPSSHNDSTKVISGPTATNGKTPPRDRGGVFRGSAGDSTPAEHPHDNVQGGLEFRRGCCRYLRVAGLLGLFISLRLLGSYF
jgi:hypothetical protein